MILIPAKIKCDEYECDATADVELVLKHDERNIPVLELHQSNGWTLAHRIYGYGNEEEHQSLCPTHNPHKR